MYSATEQASTMYYLYVTDKGETVISDISPYFRSDLFGEYHPHNPWRCVGLAYNDASSDISGAGSVAPALTDSRIYVREPVSGAGYGSTDTYNRRYNVLVYLSGAHITRTTSASAGDEFVIHWPGKYRLDLTDWNSTASAMDPGFALNPSLPISAAPSASTIVVGTAYSASTSQSVTVGGQYSGKIGDRLYHVDFNSPVGQSNDGVVGAQIALVE
jgi:hypothetical protein